MSIVFIDIETTSNGKQLLDIGALSEKKELHTKSFDELSVFLEDVEYLCGHNIFAHDLKYLEKPIKHANITKFIDTLYWSPLLFPNRPYHKLVKDDKLQSDDINNPLNDAKKARDLFLAEITAFNQLDENLKKIYYTLLSDHHEFQDFFVYVNYAERVQDIDSLIKTYFYGKICENASIAKIAGKYPIELCFALALIHATDRYSITPPWVLKNFPRVENIVHFLRSRKCLAGCKYCNTSFDEVKALKQFFHYDSFRSYEGEELQRNAVVAAIENQSILAIFPTGGGKSITFQLPALMAGVNEKGLTVVISPLQSLMKDQVDNLEEKGITEAVTINGLLDPIERAKSFERVEDGSASLLYISPESLRSKSIEGLLLKRNVVRFVIDEAHCFSAWGHDFRVDYLYIGDFIKELQEKKNLTDHIPISCFTATAKQNVINDIKDYFREKLSLELELFRASAARTNLTYHVFNEENDTGKYLKLRNLLDGKNCPTIIYVSRTHEIAKRLTEEGYSAVPFNGKMDKEDKIKNQDLFMGGKVQIIVATTAFGMGVDKKDVGMVIHYDISDSLENYVQEAGRAGRDEAITADCYVLFNDEDLNKHFILLNQNKLSIKEIQQVWKAIKNITKLRSKVSQSALEIARKSGWDDSVMDIESRVKTAISALEQSGFLKRGQNMPRIFANSILAKNAEEAIVRINASSKFDDRYRGYAVRIIKNLISAKSKSRGNEDEAESRVDYIADRLGIVKEDVIRTINLLREEKILADAKDLSAFIRKKEHVNHSLKTLKNFHQLEKFMLSKLNEGEQTWNIKELNGGAEEVCEEVSLNQINTIINFWAIKNWIKRTLQNSKNHLTIKPNFSIEELEHKKEKRDLLAQFIIEYLYGKCNEKSINNNEEETIVEFSCVELKEHFEKNLFGDKTDFDEIDDALYYLLKINALRIEGAFLVVYNAMQIERTEKDNRAIYKKEDYSQLEEFYNSRMQQIHIVGEYANRMVNDYQDALIFVNDYFTMNYDRFLSKYFKGNRREEIKSNITPKKFKKIFGELSPAQLSIITDKESKYIVVAAGPGSGKTKLLAHKLASLYMMEDVKHEQMLMLTFSRAAATEFKKRLMGLIGNAANFIQIMTFHSYCFDLLGKVGSLEKTDEIIKNTIEKINSGDVDISRITKTVLVIDEAQDMSEIEFLLIKTLMEKNEEMRVISVGDDDQNIYEFRASNSKYMEEFLTYPESNKYELIDNYRSKNNIVEFANLFATQLPHRIKSTPIYAKDRTNGQLKVIKYSTENLTIPVVQNSIKETLTGSTSILTKTNEQALEIVSLLIKNNIPAKLIQTNTGFSLFDLVEIRYFIDSLNFRDDSYTIEEDVWKNAKIALNRHYSGSSNLKECQKLLQDFEDTNNKIKYKSDFEQFIRESKLEDFQNVNDGTILVSTIHKAKGREFDNVFLAYSQNNKLNEDDLRAVYVAITRAKKNLFIHYSGNCFDNIRIESTKIIIDNYHYGKPDEIVYQLSHKEVKLSYFEFVQNRIEKIKAGAKLDMDEVGCCYEGKQVLKYSKSFTEEISKRNEQGYMSSFAEVRAVVYWKNKESTNDEVKIILPNICLKRRNI
ncbi:hypothetical protein FACS1894145_0590 [Bacteroidia bacterium]|nr:hypothetical protein FACS1894145_0590 [Bacteroidia bacterium]